MIASLFVGWEKPFVAVLDNDNEGRRRAKELRERLLLEERKIIMVSNTKDSTIEDLFTNDDFNKYILPDNEQNNDPTTPNSKFIRRMNKVLLARSFFEKAFSDGGDIKLSKETISNFTDVFGKIGDGFSQRPSPSD